MVSGQGTRSEAVIQSPPYGQRISDYSEEARNTSKIDL